MVMGICSLDPPIITSLRSNRPDSMAEWLTEVSHKARLRDNTLGVLDAVL